MKRVTFTCSSIVLLSAFCASLVSESASSRKIILKGTSESDTVRAKSFILPLTTSIPRSSEAFSSSRLSR
ncbi:Uncharacterised protein [uncultured archaeon]|nr:Uncharacterised protein [uncultured archaeon]